ncbi:hypothetical protein TWF696_005037 [Orbilia brochopaga]|uniref:Uncharacterized protein n=1 Tax=Orbilia brochopaga TaxID=3140254 RepID=A0AAV9UZL1_9PEZI
MPARYTLIHQPQHRTSSHLANWERYYCTICNSAPHPTLPYELYQTITSDPFCVQVLASKFSTSRAAVSNAYYARIPVHPTRESASVIDRRLRGRGTKLQILTDRQRNASADASFETSRRVFTQKDAKLRRGLKAAPRAAVDRDNCDAVVVAVNKKNKGSKGRSLKGRRAWLDGEMDIDDAKLVNWDHEMNFERDDVWEQELCDGSDDEGQLEQLRTLFPDAQVGGEKNTNLGDALSDEDLRALGLLYDSPDEEAEMELAHSTHSHSHPHICEHIEAVMERMPDTPRATPYTPEGSAADAADMDEVWVIVGERVVRVVPEAPSEWDVVSEYLLT